MAVLDQSGAGFACHQWRVARVRSVTTGGDGGYFPVGYRFDGRRLRNQFRDALIRLNPRSHWHICKTDLKSAALFTTTFCTFLREFSSLGTVGLPCCLPRHSGLLCASSRHRTEQISSGELSMRFQHCAKQAMMGGCLRTFAHNADMTIVFGN